MEPKKSNAIRLKSAKYKTHVIKEQIFKRMSYNKIKMNQSYDLSYETLFLHYQKVPKVKTACSYSKEGDLY